MKTTTLLLTVLFFALSGCKNKETKSIEKESEFIEITKEDFNTKHMTFITPIKKAFDTRLNVTGRITPDIDGKAEISAPIEGIIKKIHVQVGQYVNEGDCILEIGGNALINNQQDLSTSSAKMKQLKSNYKRTKKLYQDNIKTENEMMMVESAYKSELANYEALKLKLKNLGLNIKNIEDGIYTSTYKVKAPIKGQVATTNTTLGQFTTPQEIITEIINTDKIQLHLAIFERDFSSIRVGQKMHFNTLGQKKNDGTATISRVGKMLNQESNSFACFAKITSSDKHAFIINQVVQAEIITSTDSVWAVPQNAIITIGQNQYVYIKEKEDKDIIHLSKLKIQEGRTNDGFIELINFPQDKLILVSGTDNASKN